MFKISRCMTLHFYCQKSKIKAGSKVPSATTRRPPRPGSTGVTRSRSNMAASVSASQAMESNILTQVKYDQCWFECSNFDCAELCGATSAPHNDVLSTWTEIIL